MVLIKKGVYFASTKQNINNMAKKRIQFDIDEKYFDFLSESAKKEYKKGPNEFVKVKLMQEIDLELKKMEVPNESK